MAAPTILAPWHAGDGGRRTPRPPRTMRCRRWTLAVAFVTAVWLLVVGVARAAEPIGPTFRVSFTGVVGDPTRTATSPAVASNSVTGEYLVVWRASALATVEDEIFAQRLSTTGAALGDVIRVSTTGTDGDAARVALEPDVTFNSVANEYLVVWAADGLATDNEYEVFGQRLSAAGAEIGGDVRLSTTWTDGDATRQARDPAVTFNHVANEYLVVWEADGLPTDDEREVFGQRLSAAGAEVGADVRLSRVGTDGDNTRSAGNPVVALNGVANEYLVAWDADALVLDEKFEVFGQRVSAAGVEVGGHTRLSTTGSDGDAALDAANPAVAYNNLANEYLVTWDGEGLGTEGEFEVFGQRVSGAGAVVGDETRLSTTGTDGDAGRDAFSPSVSFNRVANEYLVTWFADGLVTDDEDEVFAQRVTAIGTETGGDIRLSTTGTDGDATRAAFAPAVAFSSVATEYVAVWEADGLAADNKYEVFGRRFAGAIPPPPSPPAPPPSIDVRAPVLRLAGTVRQRVARRGRVVITARSDEACTLRVQVTVRRVGRRVPLATFTVRPPVLPANVATSLRIPLSAAQRRAITRNLAGRGRVRVTVAVTATDAAGNRGRAVTRTVRAIP